MTYISQESFRSTGGERFSYGQEIGDYEYNKLSYQEKMKFRRKYMESSQGYGSMESDYPPLGVFGANGGHDDSPSPSSHSHFDYGGGDTGGGGSDSSWDSGSSSDSGGSDGGGGDGGGD